MALTGGPARDFKWGGIVLRPTDGELEYQAGGFTFENMASGNGDTYAEGTPIVGYVSQECAMTVPEFNDFIKLRDGASRSGTLTSINGDVLSLDCIIDGDESLSNGKVTIKLSGKVKVQ